MSLGSDGPVRSILSRTGPDAGDGMFSESEGARRSALPWRKMGSGGEVEGRGGDVGASEVGSIPEVTMSCVAPGLEGPPEVGEIWTLSTGRWVGCEYCELSNGCTAARFSTT